MHVVQRVTDLLELDGTELGTSPWHRIEQGDIDTFADLTDDHQWIHVDRARAAEGPYGATIAHGMLTLALVPVLVGKVLRVENAGFGLNYGFNKVRFTAPVPVGSRVRGRVSVVGTEPVTGGVRAAFAVVVELEGSDRPACVAEQVIVWLT